MGPSSILEKSQQTIILALEFWDHSEELGNRGFISYHFHCPLRAHCGGAPQRSLYRLLRSSGVLQSSRNEGYNEDQAKTRRQPSRLVTVAKPADEGTTRSRERQKKSTECVTFSLPSRRKAFSY